MKGLFYHLHSNSIRLLFICRHIITKWHFTFKVNSDTNRILRDQTFGDSGRKTFEDGGLTRPVGVKTLNSTFLEVWSEHVSLLTIIEFQPSRFGATNITQYSRGALKTPQTKQDTITQTTTCRLLAAIWGHGAERPPPRTAFFFFFSSDDDLRHLDTHLLSVTGAFDEESVWGTRRQLFTSCELPLVEQSQHCDVILEFFYKYLIRKQEKNKK